MSKRWFVVGALMISGCYEAELRIDRGYRARSSYDVSSPYDCPRCGTVAVVPMERDDQFQGRRVHTESGTRRRASEAGDIDRARRAAHAWHAPWLRSRHTRCVCLDSYSHSRCWRRGSDRCRVLREPPGTAYYGGRRDRRCRRDQPVLLQRLSVLRLLRVTVLYSIGGYYPYYGRGLLTAADTATAAITTAGTTAPAGTTVRHYRRGYSGSRGYGGYYRGGGYGGYHGRSGGVATRGYSHGGGSYRGGGGYRRRRRPRRWQPRRRRASLRRRRVETPRRPCARSRRVRGRPRRGRTCRD